MTMPDRQYPRQPWDKPEELSDDVGSRAYDLNGQTHGSERPGRAEGTRRGGNVADFFSGGFRNTSHRLADTYFEAMDKVWESATGSRESPSQERSVPGGRAGAGWAIIPNPPGTGGAPPLFETDPEKSWIRILRRQDETLE